MKKLIVFRKLSIQLIVAVAISFLVSMAVLIILSQIMILYYMDNQGNISQFLFNISYLIILTVCVAAFIIIFLILIKRKLGYIKYISEQVSKIAKKELGSTLQVKGNDELADLCKNINSMSIQLKGKFEHEREIENTKTELITNVSHDLRTPLTAIIGYLDILKNKKYKSKEDAEEYVTTTYNLSVKLKELIDELFEYTKLSSSDIVLDFIEADLGNILNQMLGEYAPIFESKGLKIIKHIDEDISVKVDIEKIVRVLDNILSNAEKYSIKPSEIIVRTTKKENVALISIANKGEHINPEKLNKIFEKFYRVDTSRSNTIEGSGLGLAISKKIIELHNGEIWAECHEDMITVSIRIPII